MDYSNMHVQHLPHYLDLLCEKHRNMTDYYVNYIFSEYILFDISYSKIPISKQSFHARAFFSNFELGLHQEKLPLQWFCHWTGVPSTLKLLPEILNRLIFVGLAEQIYSVELIIYYTLLNLAHKPENSCLI